jgi:hypothetical protein
MEDIPWELDHLVYAIRNQFGQGKSHASLAQNIYPIKRGFRIP